MSAIVDLFGDKAKTLSNLLTNSRLKCVRQCPRLHHLKYDLGYRPVEEAEEADFGNVMHLGLEAWWLCVMRGEPCIDNWLIAAAEAIRGGGLDEYAEARAVAMMSGYHARWSDDANDYEVLGVEEVFELPLINPATGGRSPAWKVGGKLDVRVRRKSDGKLGIIEHKTSSENVAVGSFYWARLRLDSQVSTYFDGAAVLSAGELPDFCLYDVLGKPAQRPLKATPLESRKYTKQGALYANQRDVDETAVEYFERITAAISEEPTRYFTRAEVLRLDGELDEARAEVWQQAASMRENLNAGRFPRNSEACGAYGRPCAFFDVCTGAASLDEPRLFTRTDNVHPELAGHPTSAEGPKEGLEQ